MEQLDDLNVDNYTDGTYIVCIKKNQQRAELKMGVYRQRLAPTDNSIPNNTLWLDTSTENIQCYEKLNNVWTTKYDGVPIGEDRSIGGVASWFTGKDTALTKANNSMDELVSQLRQAALVASGISGESDDKAQQAKLKDIYERAGVPMNAKSLTQAQVSSIINNIENIYKQRVAEKQSLLDSFNNNSVSWE